MSFYVGSISFWTQIPAETMGAAINVPALQLGWEQNGGHLLADRFPATLCQNWTKPLQQWWMQHGSPPTAETTVQINYSSRNIIHHTLLPTLQSRLSRWRDVAWLCGNKYPRTHHCVGEFKLSARKMYVALQLDVVTRQ